MYRPTYEPSYSSSQPNQVYSQLNRLNLDMDMKNLFNTQEYYAVQGSGHDYYACQVDSLVEEVAVPVKAKKVSKRRQKTLPPKEGFKTSPWTIEEVTLCQAWCDVSENSITGNAVNSKGFWLKVIKYFEKETGSNRGYDSILTEYDHDFSLEPCWQILKNHPDWKQVEMPAYYSKRNPGSKKAKTSETTSGSAQGGLNLNEEGGLNLNEDANGSEEEVREVRPIGRDRAKKKSSTSSRYEASFVAGEGIVDMVADKWKSLKSANGEAAELKRQELELKRKNLELKLRNKRDKDLRFYMKKIDETLRLMQQEKLKEMKQEIKELYDLDF
nr:hypothetical protein [Tanacetum cinerariifolium]